MRQRAARSPAWCAEVLTAALISSCIAADHLRVSANADGAAEITTSAGLTRAIAKEPGQVGIRSPQVAADGATAGWLVDFADPDSASPYAGTLVIWRAGRVIRRFQSEQAFYSWAFYGGKQVAFHSGPLHGEAAARCELHDIASGRRLAHWDGDLHSADKPVWTAHLDH